jgi:hypothetical protein
MKYLKILAIAVVAIFAFEGAKAQVIVKARVGAPVHHRYYHPRTVVVTRPAGYHRPNYRPYRRTVVVNRPVYRRHYYAQPHYSRVVVRRHY